MLTKHEMLKTGTIVENIIGTLSDWRFVIRLFKWSEDRGMCQYVNKNYSHNNWTKRFKQKDATVKSKYTQT